MRLFSQQQGTNYYKMTFGIISGELFIVEKIASETCRRHPRDDRMYTENSTQGLKVGHENEATVKLWLDEAGKTELKR